MKIITNFILILCLCLPGPALAQELTGTESDQKILEILQKKVSLRRALNDRMGSHLTQPQWQGDMLEEMLSTEITVLPQILYARATLTFLDITRGYDLFLPPLILLPEKNFKKYQSAWGTLAAGPAPENLSAGAAAPASLLFADKSFSRKTYYLILNSPTAQKDFIAAEWAKLEKKISELSVTDPSDPAVHFNMGNAYLLSEFYTRLNNCLSYYRQAQLMIPKIINTPTYTSLQAFRSQMNKAATDVECAKIPLPAVINENMEVDSFEFARIGDKIKDVISQERMEGLNQFKRLVNPIYGFNLLSISEPALSAFRQAAELKRDNAQFRLRLGNIYRIMGLKSLNDQLESLNTHHLGYEWNNQPDWKYDPINENAAIDLTEAQGFFSQALAEYQAVEKLDPQLGRRALGIYNLSQLSLNPGLAQTAVSDLKSAGEDEASLLALEYAYYLLDFKGAFDLAIKTYKKIPDPSSLKSLGASLLGEGILDRVLAQTRKRIIDKETYTNLASKLEEAKPLDPDNPYIDLLQGYMYFRRGTTMSVEDALSVVMSSFAMAGKSMFAMVDMMSEIQKTDPKSLESRDKLESYADAKGKQLEEEFEREFGFNNEIVVRKYRPEDFKKAVEIYQAAIGKNPDLAMSYYYLGRAYAVLGLYYSALEQKDEALIKQYRDLAQEALKKYLLLSYKT